MSARPTPLPRWVQAIAALAAALFAAPLVGLALQVPWPELSGLLLADETVDALWLSLQCSVTAAALSVVLGLPLATWLAGGDSLLHRCVRVIATLPMVLPPVVGGIALLLAFGQHGIVGQPLAQWFGVTVPFTTASVVLATTYVAMPYFVLTVEGGIRSCDPRYAAAATTLGATPWRAFCTVTLPMVAPSLRAGLLVAWARALGEFGATITFAGSFQGSTRTLPLAIYHALEAQPDAAIALSMLLLLVSAAVLFLLRRQWFPTP